MPRRRKKNLMSTREQARAIFAVAKMTAKTAPGAVIFKLSGSVVDAVLPIVTTYFAALTTTALADAYGGDEDAGRRVLLYVIVTALLGLALTSWRSIDQYIQAKMRYVVEAKVSDQMYEQFLNLEFWRYDDKETIDLYDKAQKFAQFFAWVFDRIASVISQLIGVVVAIIALTVVNAWLALFVLVAIAPGIYIQFKLSRTQINHWNKNVEARRIQSQIEWNLLQPNEIAELRTYGLVRHFMKLRAFYRDKDEKARIDFEGKFILWRLLADGLEAIAELSALIWIALQIIARAQPIGQFLYVQQVVSRAIGSANGFVSQLSTIDEDVANLFDYERFMQLPVRVGGTHSVTKTPGLIRFENVSFRYGGKGRPEVLSDVSLDITRNQHIAIVGENGAGKSTFIKLLLGLYDPTQGMVSVDGVDLRTIDIQSWHKQIGLLKQDFIKYYFANARDNVVYGDVDKVYKEKNIKVALQAAEADKFIDKLPRGLDNYVNDWMEDDEGNKGIDLSGGQWQRLALARSFYRDAPILILDEPTSAIDALAESRIFDRLFKEKNKTIIAISHRVTTIRKADVVYMFEDGKIVEVGTHAELVAKKGSYYRMFESQLDV